MTTEVEFLKKLAIDRYNGQFGKKFNTYEFCIRSSTIVPGYDFAYELITLATDDYLRLKMNLRFTNRDYLGPYRMEIVFPTMAEIMGDEIFVTFGELDIAHRHNNEYKFFDLNTCGGNFILHENGNGFVTEEGDFLEAE